MYNNKLHINITFAILGLICLASCDNNSPHTDLKNAGKNLYEQNCVICHGKDGKLKVAAAKDLSESTLSKELVIQAIQKGSPQKGMPPYENRLKPNEIEEISEYVLKLRK